MNEETAFDSDLYPEQSAPADTEVVSRKGWYWFSGILLVILLLCIFTVLSYGQYGWTLFIALPFTFGFVLTFLQSRQGAWPVIRKVGLALLVVIALSALLLAAGAEGMICILMAVGILFVPIFLGILLGFWVRRWTLQKQLPVFIPILLLSPATFTYDLQDTRPIEAEVRTRTVIHASPEKVWQVLTHRVAFGQSDNLLLRSGVSHPVSMELQPDSAGYALFCVTNNDTTRLTVTELMPEQKMRFSHTEEIIPMREVTFYGNLDAPHLHDYFHSAYGQFEIIRKDDHTCELIATTQYTYRIAPRFYWQWWTEYLIDAMHSHVLQTIQQQAEP